jgi:hypothetical protein
MTTTAAATKDKTKTDQELFAALQWLTEAWCDRRALTALRYLLQAYPMQEPGVEGLAVLLIALKDVRAFAREELTEPELLLVNDCVLVVDRKMNPA